LQVNETSSAAASSFDFSAFDRLLVAFCEIDEWTRHSFVGDGAGNEAAVLKPRSF